MTNHHGFYDPEDVRDACGVGFVSDRRGRRTHRMIQTAVRCLHALDHRGARSSDGTGDGAGLMTRIPFKLFERDLVRMGITPVGEGRLGVFMVFLPTANTAAARDVVETAARREDLDVLGWRTVPVGTTILSETARRSLPVIEQLMVAAPETVSSDDFERKMYLARRLATRQVEDEAFFICSASSRTIVYKGLFLASTVEQFYWDLVDPMFETDFAIFHQRYSTNTFPAWGMAQPFRMLAHNGEINTVQANRSWMAARSNDLVSDLWGERLSDLNPLIEPLGSDSASLDNAFEVLVRSGRSVSHTKEMLMPQAWENVSDLSDEMRAFYEYHAFLSEPWDGPAAIAASDGRHLIAGLDRNGLRPSRWTMTDDIVIVASEAGLSPADEVEAIATGQLGPGDVLFVDLEDGRVIFADEVRERLAAKAPYVEWITTETQTVHGPFDDEQDERYDATKLARVFGYTAEERRLILQPMAQGVDPMLSMGHDTGLAALSEWPQRLPRYFHQAFAQVTNPPMDPIREKLVMSLRTYLGRRGSILTETAQQAHLLELHSSVLSDAELQDLTGNTDPHFRSHKLDITFDAASGTEGMLGALDELCDEASAAVAEGVSILVLTDMGVTAARAPLPVVAAVGAVHHRLIDDGLRLHASIIAVSGEPRDAHDFACLVGVGASAVYPYLAIEQVRRMALEGAIDVGPVEAQENYRRSLETGLLKIMSKMGICTISSYRGSELFEAIGLDHEVVDRAFRRVQHRIGGVGWDRIEHDIIRRHADFDTGKEDLGGYYKHRRGGMPHIAAPRAVLALQRAVRSGAISEWETYIAQVQDDRPALEIRDLLAIGSVGTPVPVDEVEPIERIMRRFTTAAMSLGAISSETHETLAEAMNYIGGMSNSGEGGEDPERFGTSRNSRIKQIASGRFGITPGYLASAEEFQIKMAQGSKPGEGGQLPGHKVTPAVAALRHTLPGVTLISPPPHHDIYSIEDLAQLIYDLKTFKPLARVSVKLVSGPGVGTIAVGVAKALADGITISGNAGGTGASPLASIKHAGSPWELGLAEAHQALVHNGLRSGLSVETDGGMRTGRDVIIAALLGADRYGWGTVPLLALGCKMVRQCHLNTCPVGIATQREDLRAKYTGSVDQVVALFRHVGGEIRHHLAAMGARTLAEVVGRADLLTPFDGSNPVAAAFVDRLGRSDFSSSRHFKSIERSRVGELLAVEGRRAVARGTTVDLAFPIRNTDRAIGTRLSGEIADLTDGLGAADGTVTVRLSGTAGQSFGAFLSPGVSMYLLGTANDYVGKSMGGGVISIAPHRSTDERVQGAGNACLYGATGGELYVAGAVGQRFAVRNSGAVAVVEGMADHGCEYMTGGTVVCLGAAGRNIAAGMTGGVLFLWDPVRTSRRQVATTNVPHELSVSDGEHLAAIIARHVALTASERGSQLLNRWDAAKKEFLVIRPEAPVWVDPAPITTSSVL
ncbi:MAG: glutamate synthase large subunit [Actinobacteria bacterium]|nr:glutamate synthase large subunit [Actinomycetota bacterium]